MVVLLGAAHDEAAAVEVDVHRGGGGGGGGGRYTVQFTGPALVGTWRPSVRLGTSVKRSSSCTRVIMPLSSNWMPLAWTSVLKGMVQPPITETLN